LVIAHRGDTRDHLENTLPAIESAVKLGVDGIEVDLQLTRDERVVLFHDDDLKRLAQREGTIQDFSLAELQKIPLINRGSIPTLEDLLDLAGKHCLLNLEIKTLPHCYAPGDGRLEKKIAECLHRFSLDESILMSSFHPLPLWRMKRLSPHLKRGVLFEDHYGIHRMLMGWTSPFSINAPFARATKEFVRSAHDAKRRVLVWTVNNEDDISRCLEDGVDGIITDEPRRLKIILERTRGQR